MRTQFCLACGAKASSGSAYVSSSVVIQPVDDDLQVAVGWNEKCVEDPNALPLVGLESDSALKLLLGDKLYVLSE